MRPGHIMLCLLAGAAAVLAGAPAGAAPRAQFVPGDFVVSGPGLAWLHADGSSAGQIVARSVRVSAAAFRARGKGPPLYAIHEPLVMHTYDAAGAEQNFFVADAVARRTTALGLGSNGIEYPAVTHGKINQLYVFKYNAAKGSGEELVALFVVPAPVTDVAPASDGCTVFYSTSLGIGRVNACTLDVLPNLLTGVDVGRIRLLPDQTMLLVTAGGREIRRISGDGRTERTYGAPGRTGWTGVDLADGTSFWAVTRAGAAVRFDLATGAILAGPLPVPAPATDIAVYDAPEGVAPPVPSTAGGQELDFDRVPPLTDEILSGFLPVRAKPERVCGPSASTLTFADAYGATIGPYGGGFVAGAEARVGPQTLATRLGTLGLRGGPVRLIAGAFVIGKGATKVTGTFTGGGAGNIATCATFTKRTFPDSLIFPPTYVLSGYDWALNAPTLRYAATITRGGRTYSDQGRTFLIAARFNLVDLQGRDSGSGGRYSQHFASDSIGVTETFAEAGQKRPHSAGIPAEAQTIELVTTWERASDRFDLNVSRLVRGRSVSGASADPLKITTKRGPKSVTVRVSGVQSGRLLFSVNGERVGKKTKVKTKIVIVHRHRTGRSVRIVDSPLARLAFTVSR